MVSTVAIKVKNNHNIKKAKGKKQKTKGERQKNKTPGLISDGPDRRRLPLPPCCRRAVSPCSLHCTVHTLTAAVDLSRHVPVGRRRKNAETGHLHGSVGVTAWWIAVGNPARGCSILT